jgi:hypothetical protein
MGYYIQGPTKGKATQLTMFGATSIPCPKRFEDIPSDKALICIVDNGAFEAAAYCFSECEFKAFSRCDDPRPKQWMIMDKASAEKASGYKR